MSNTRDAILNRLRNNTPKQCPMPESYRPWVNNEQINKADLFCKRMRSVKTEVVELGKTPWIDWVIQELPQRKLRRVLVGNNPLGQNLIGQANEQLAVSFYDQPIKSWKQALFNDIDVAITGTLGAIAETGSLILWPDSNEPRLMSLVPPVHIVVLNEDHIYQNFTEAMAAKNWVENMPTNALLISGPSKTADIEQTLAYGIHGPQKLIVLLQQ